jgi:uncharacterized protein (DUF427 family)
MKSPLPTWAELGRQGFTHRGGKRPSFAAEPGPGQESVWDYPRPPRVVADTREVVVSALGMEIARTRAALRVLETSHPPTFYLPRNDVKMAYLVPAGGGSRCEWKGEASYFDIVVAEQRLARVAWSYERPFDDAAPLAGHLAFYASHVEATVGGQRVLAQPGRFYGGWITPELAGPFKGEPGSEGW